VRLWKPICQAKRIGSCQKEKVVHEKKNGLLPIVSMVSVTAKGKASLHTKSFIINRKKVFSSFLLNQQFVKMKIRLIRLRRNIMLGKNKYLYVLFVAGLLFFIQPVWAENPTSHDTPWEKFSLTAGYFISNVDTDLSVGSDLGITVNAEDLLGLDTTNSVFRIGASWRFTDNRRHRLDLTWFSFRRDGSTTVGRDFTIKDDEDNEIVVPAGSQVNTKFDLDIYKAAYSYSFFQDDRVDLRFSLGLYVMPIDIGLQATGLINVDETERFTAPLPTLGLRADFAINPKCFLRTGLEVFYLEINEFTGTIYESHVAVEYLPWKHFGFGLGFNTFNLNIESDGEDYWEIDFKGELDFRYSGLLLYAKLFY
jgi:hypothetical protein